MTRRRSRTLDYRCAVTASLLLGPLSCAVGCKTADPPPPVTAETPNLPAPPPSEMRGLQISLQGPLAECRTDEPFFFYDQARLRPQDVDELRALASCLQSVPHQDADLLLVGRADHRGDREYNLELARARAERVAELLREHGVEEERLSVTSRGEEGAIGHESSMASLGYDRRVDILIVDAVAPGPPAEPVHNPGLAQ